MKILLLFTALIISITSCQNKVDKNTAMNEEKISDQMKVNEQSIHQFVVKDIFNNDFNLIDLKGKKVMIVNTASKCGFTPQYEDLQNLYTMYGGANFEIIGFPANNFKQQEPGSNEEIITFCKENYGVTFPMMSKISVKGDDIHPLYQFLTQKEQNKVLDSEVQWNFQKYLIDEEGQLVHVIAPKVKPFDSQIIDWIDGNSKSNM